MANAASGVATAPAGTAGCQVSPSLKRARLSTASSFPACSVGRSAFYLKNSEYRRKTGRKQMEVLAVFSRW
jgi:hypothetical protein